MKWIIWTVGALLAALWTGTLAVVALLVGWTSQVLQDSGGSVPAATSLPTLELPAWLALWIDLPAWQAAQEQALQVLASVQQWLPALGTATAWLEPVVWTVWGLGMVLLVGAAGASHWLLGRLGSPAPRAG